MNSWAFNLYSLKARLVISSEAVKNLKGILLKNHDSSLGPIDAQ